MSWRRARRQRSGFVGFASRWFRRIRRIAMVASVAAAAYRWWQRRSGDGGSGGGGGGSGRKSPTGGPIAPSPLRAVATPETEPALAGTGQASVVSVAAPTRSDGVAGDPGRAWVSPLDGGDCPASHPVKVNERSGIFHLPGGFAYARTRAARCYVDPAAATADGYRPSKA